MTYDLIIRNGTVVDGTGRARRVADVGIVGDRVVDVIAHDDGGIAGLSRRTIDATDRLVTPGFVDIHTHLDVQVHWDPLVTPSSWNGVTTVVFGNGGLSLAPCRDADRELVAAMYEGIEDLPPELTLNAPSWEWETFADYLAVVEHLPKAVNVGALVGHGAVRVHAMGERAFGENPATRDDIDAMVHLVDEAMAAGALGFSTSRTSMPRLRDGRVAPGSHAAADELLALTGVLGDHGAGIVDAAIPLGGRDGAAPDRTRAEIALLGEIARHSGRPVTFGLTYASHRPDLVAHALEFVREENGRGGCIRPQTPARSVGILFGLETRTPFDRAPSWKELRAAVNGRKLQLVRDPNFRQTLIKEADVHGTPINLDELFILPADEVRYDFRPEDSLHAIATARGVSPAAAFIELVLETDGELVASLPFLNQDLTMVEELLTDPLVAVGLTDAGAHVGQLTDAGQPTFCLSYWVRERECWTIEEGVRRLTSDVAGLFGVHDRGLLTPGAFADVNVIDFDELGLSYPEYESDLPDGSGRYVQRAHGYDYTIVNGEVIFESGERAGPCAGRLIRST